MNQNTKANGSSRVAPNLSMRGALTTTSDDKLSLVVRLLNEPYMYNPFIVTSRSCGLDIETENAIYSNELKAIQKQFPNLFIHTPFDTKIRLHIKM